MEVNKYLEYKRVHNILKKITLITDIHHQNMITKTSSFNSCGPDDLRHQEKSGFHDAFHCFILIHSKRINCSIFMKYFQNAHNCIRVRYYHSNHSYQ